MDHIFTITRNPIDNPLTCLKQDQSFTYSGGRKLKNKYKGGAKKNAFGADIFDFEEYIRVNNIDRNKILKHNPAFCDQGNKK